MIAREIKETDIAKVAELFDDYRVFYRKESDVKGAEKFILERVQQKDSKIYVCENTEKQLLGFVQLYPLFSSTRMKKLWLLNDLFVHPKYRGQGIAIQLIEKAKALVKETDACGLVLETEKSNSIGNRLYPKTGFSLNEAANYYEWINH